MSTAATRALDAIEAAEPDTAAALLAVLHEHPGATAAFIDADQRRHGHGGVRTLADALYDLGWFAAWAATPAHYVMEHEQTGERITYRAGAVLAGDRRPRRRPAAAAA